LDANQAAEKEEFEAKQKELEAIVTPILQSLGGGAGAGGMPGGMPDMSGMPGGGFGGGGGGGAGSTPAADEGPKIEEID
jgi:L1 cell adhesion molecule like protein